MRLDGEIMRLESFFFNTKMYLELLFSSSELKSHFLRSLTYINLSALRVDFILETTKNHPEQTLMNKVVDQAGNYFFFCCC